MDYLGVVALWITSGCIFIAVSVDFSSTLFRETVHVST